MADDRPTAQQVDQFILSNIESVPHLESLLLLWNERPKPWTSAALAARLYVDRQVAQKVLQDLAQRDLIAAVPGKSDEFCYESKNDDRDRLLEAVSATYRRELVRISTLIHSKAPAAVREFAKAFRFKKEQSS